MISNFFTNKISNFGTERYRYLDLKNSFCRLNIGTMLLNKFCVKRKTKLVETHELTKTCIYIDHQ